MSVFELMVAVAIAITLIAIGVLSTRTLLTRTKVSRVRADQRVVARALQNYNLDYSQVPGARQGLRALTMPTAYLGAVPSDPFQKNTGSFLYLAPPGDDRVTVVVSPGPDGDFDLPPDLWQFAALGEVEPNLLPLHYQPQNMPPGYAAAAAVSPSRPMNERERALLDAYLQFKQYDSAKGSDGDIVTVVRY